MFTGSSGARMASVAPCRSVRACTRGSRSRISPTASYAARCAAAAAPAAPAGCGRTVHLSVDAPHAAMPAVGPPGRGRGAVPNVARLVLELGLAAAVVELGDPIVLPPQRWGERRGGGRVSMSCERALAPWRAPASRETPRAMGCACALRSHLDQVHVLDALPVLVVLHPRLRRTRRWLDAAQRIRHRAEG